MNETPESSGYIGWVCTTAGYAVKEAWTTSDTTALGKYVNYDGNIYVATTAGTTGATPPTHTSGTVSDGGVSWRYVATSPVAVFYAYGPIS